MCNCLCIFSGLKRWKKEGRNIFWPSFAERGPMMTSPWPRRSDGKSPQRHALRRQPDSLDSVDSCSSVSSYSSSSHFHPSSSSSSATTRRFRFHAKSPPAGSGLAQAQPMNAPQASRSDSLDSSPPGDQEGAFDERPQFTSRGTFNPEKGKQKLKGAKHSSLRHSREGDGHGRDPPDIPQQLVLYGSNEFMVWRTLGHQSTPYSTPWQAYTFSMGDNAMATDLHFSKHSCLAFLCWSQQRGVRKCHVQCFHPRRGDCWGRGTEKSVEGLLLCGLDCHPCSNQCLGSSLLGAERRRTEQEDREKGTLE